MNCLNYNTKNDFINYINTLSEDDANLQRKINSNLLSILNSDYSDYRNCIKTKFLKTAKALKDNNDSPALFKSLLKNTFEYTFSIQKRIDEYKSFSKSTSIETSNNFDKLFSQIKDLFLKFKQLNTLILNQTAIFAYRIYSEVYLDERFLKEYTSYAIFGGRDNSGQPNYLYTLDRYIYQLAFNLDFVEGRIE